MSYGVNVVCVGHLTARDQWVALEDRFSHTTQSEVMEL